MTPCIHIKALTDIAVYLETLYNQIKAVGTTAVRLMTPCIHIKTLGAIYVCQVKEEEEDIQFYAHSTSFWSYQAWD